VNPPEEDRPDGIARPGAGALAVVAATLALGPLGAVGLADVLDRHAAAGVPAGVLAGALGAPLAFALLVAGYARVVNARERRGEGGADG
jgi:hypothetical protein